MIAGFGDMLPVSAFMKDGTLTATAQWERKYRFGNSIWEKKFVFNAICALVCPHAAIRIKAYGENELTNAPAVFQLLITKERNSKE